MLRDLGHLRSDRRSTAIPDGFSMQGRVALVTGASRGLGQGPASALAEGGRRRGPARPERLTRDSRADREARATRDLDRVRPPRSRRRRARRCRAFGGRRTRSPRRPRVRWPGGSERQWGRAGSWRCRSAGGGAVAGPDTASPSPVVREPGDTVDSGSRDRSQDVSLDTATTRPWRGPAGWPIERRPGQRRAGGDVLARTISSEGTTVRESASLTPSRIWCSSTSTRCWPMAWKSWA